LAAIALFYSARLQNLFDSYSRLVISRKAFDTTIISRSLILLDEAGSRGKIETSITKLVEGGHRNTAILLFKEQNRSPDLIVQPTNKIDQKTIRFAVEQWKKEPYGGDLYKKGITFNFNHDIYHLIARRQSVREGSYELLLVTDVHRSIGSEYFSSTIALSILLLLMSAVIIPTLLSVIVSVKKVTGSIADDDVVPDWFWTSEATALCEKIKAYKKDTELARIQINQSTSGQMVIRSFKTDEAILYTPNQALCNISGYSQKELEGYPLNQIVPEEFHDFHRGIGVWSDELQRHSGMNAYAQGCPFRHGQESKIVGCDRTVKLKHKDGSIRKVILGVFYVGKVEGGFDEWVGVITDVTLLTDALRVATEAKAENLQLIQAWSHDLKGQAKGVYDELSSLARLKPKFDTEAEQTCFDTALARAELTFNLITNTRDLGDLALDFRATSTNEIKDRINLIHSEKNIKFKWPDDEYFVNIDIDRFISMGFNNLIENAFKYSLGSCAEVIVGLKVDKGFAKFFVQDFGLGMDEAGQAKVMAGNFGSRVRLNPQIEGTGQGIFSAKRVFKAHGAELSLKSQLGQGSIFIVKVGLST
jgi:PAS domain-containing protein